MLMKTVISGKLQPLQLITHRFTLGRIVEAYDTFGAASETKALKVLIST
jgi:alcohol dehydrogenase